MNEAHLHLAVNHFPIVGTILGVGILVVGLALKNNSVKNTAFFLFIIAAIFAAVSMATGEGAEELVEDMPSIGHEIIHEHEEMAEKLAIALYVLAATSLVGLYLDYKKSAKAALVTYVALVIAAVAVFLAQQTGTTGGEIRHTEIRSVAIPSDIQMKEKD
jgi:uncharacterized membrane protein